MVKRVEFRTMGNTSNANAIPRYRIKYICTKNSKPDQFVIITEDNQFLLFYEESVMEEGSVPVYRFTCYCKNISREEFESIFIEGSPENMTIYTPIVEDSFIAFREFEEEGVMAIYSYFGKSFDMSGKLITPHTDLDVYAKASFKYDSFVNINKSLLCYCTHWDMNDPKNLPSMIFPPRSCIVLDDIVDFKEIAAVAAPSTRANSILFITLNNVDKYYTSNSMLYFKHIYSYDFSVYNSIFDTPKEAVKFLRKCEKNCPDQRFRICRVFVNTLGIHIVVV